MKVEVNAIDNEYIPGIVIKIITGRKCVEVTIPWQASDLDEIAHRLEPALQTLLNSLTKKDQLNGHE